MKTKERYTESTSIVLIQIPDRATLEQEFEKIQSLGIECASFYEPYEDMGMTAFSTLPIGEDLRHHFQHYPLWGRSIKGVKTPLTEFLKEEMKENQRKKKLKEKVKQIDSKLIENNLAMECV